MSFRLSTGDTLVVSQPVWRVCKPCKDAPNSFEKISGVVLSFHAVLKAVEEMAAERELSHSQIASFGMMVQGCEKVL
ncbi:hypothetical protein BGZ60DRAFT_400632 [Tricladium varicosporioides]|nr:hypothetical protein BGZ60DRAFT_400632 [Hymenoscyphus varicosporioides]